MFNNQKSFFDAWSSKTSFFLGAGSGILVVCTIGFIILLIVTLGNNSEGSLAKSANNNNQLPLENQGAVQPQAGAEALKPITKDDHLRGNLNAKVMLVEFSDLQCPFCSSVHPTLQKLVNDYQGQVAWAYKHFPIDQLHPYARKAAEASECASEQGKFWEYADDIFANQALLNDGYLTQAAGKIGLNAQKFNDCLSSGKYASKVQEHQDEGASAGITGTPGTYVNNVLIKGAKPYEEFKGVIDQLLAR